MHRAEFPRHATSGCDASGLGHGRSSRYTGDPAHGAIPNPRFTYDTHTPPHPGG